MSAPGENRDYTPAEHAARSEDRLLRALAEGSRLWVASLSAIDPADELARQTAIYDAGGGVCVNVLILGDSTVVRAVTLDQDGRATARLREVVYKPAAPDE